MVKDHSDNERGNHLLQLYGLLFSISSKEPVYTDHSIDRIAHATEFVNSIMVHMLEQETAQWVHHEGSIR